MSDISKLLKTLDEYSVPQDYSYITQDNKRLEKEIAESKKSNFMKEISEAAADTSTERRLSKMLNELKDETLASYKEKAGKQASELDKEGFKTPGKEGKKKLDKAHKRFKGINKATMKQLDRDVKKHKKLDEYSAQDANNSQANPSTTGQGQPLDQQVKSVSPEEQAKQQQAQASLAKNLTQLKGIDPKMADELDPTKMSAAPDTKSDDLKDALTKGLSGTPQEQQQTVALLKKLGSLK